LHGKLLSVAQNRDPSTSAKGGQPELGDKLPTVGDFAVLAAVDNMEIGVCPSFKEVAIFAIAAPLLRSVRTQQRSRDIQCDAEFSNPTHT
jgi:hypothetical protein